MADVSPESDLARHGRRLAGLFTFLFWAGVLWLVAECYVPLKQLAAAALAHDTPAFQQANRAFMRLVLQLAPAFAMLVAVGTARTLFGRFGAGEVLTARNGEGLRLLGASLAVAAVLALFGRPAQGGPEPLILTADVMLGAVGLAILFIGQAWARAAAAQAELDQIL